MPDCAVRVVELWRYPVKSMQGERLTDATIGDRGIVGHRQWAVADSATGAVLTARREPKLLFAAGRVTGDGVEITTDDGHVLEGDAALSAWLGRPVRLEQAAPGRRGTYETPIDFETERDWIAWDGPDGSFHDSKRTQVSLVSTATIGEWPVRRFRPNVVVDGDGEDVLVGARVGLGGAVLDVVKRIDRCVMVTRPQPGGIDRDLDVLRTIHRQRAGDLAVGCLVVRGGAIAIGDVVTGDVVPGG
jgi:uncharacterized protein YcbX